MRIGIFDSGLGGLTILEAVRQRLPSLDYLYLGDNARTPYGNRSFDAILRFTREGVEHLFASDCALVVIACNTASAKALRTLQQRWLPTAYPDRRLLGIIRPSAEAVVSRHAPEVAPPWVFQLLNPNQISASQKSPGSVALWATEGTVRSMSLPLELHKLKPDLQVVQTACPLLVPLVEAGELSGAGVEFFIRSYWDKTLAQSHDIHTLLLACTHYPLLYPAIRALIPSSVEVLTQGKIVAASLADYLQRHPELKERISTRGVCDFLTTDRSENFDSVATRFLGQPVQSQMVEIN